MHANNSSGSFKNVAKKFCVYKLYVICAKRI